MVIERTESDKAQQSGADSLKILLVEDHADTRRYLGLFLRQSGHTVREAGSIDEALELLHEGGCDVLISDIGLPDGTGWDLLEKVPGDDPVFAIAMSGYSLGADREKSRRVGFREHLVKPFDLDELEGILKDVTAGSNEGVVEDEDEDADEDADG
ncbi:MAG: response regulator [Chthoniobacterales bacterium]